MIFLQILEKRFLRLRDLSILPLPVTALNPVPEGKKRFLFQEILVKEVQAGVDLCDGKALLTQISDQERKGKIGCYGCPDRGENQKHREDIIDFRSLFHSLIIANEGIFSSLYRSFQACPCCSIPESQYSAADEAVAGRGRPGKSLVPLKSGDL
jgi:hypothetical protein